MAELGLCLCGTILGAALTENAHPGHMKAYSDESGHNTSVGRTRASLFHEALLVKICVLERIKREICR